ncbi:hypothetical protein [Nocardia sp. NPDC048505]|uniref:hypothetical protein n=1 Tax=unclassified Nocardia TaxID=2637762 RepID=UPI0033FE2983
MTVTLENLGKRVGTLETKWESWEDDRAALVDTIVDTRVLAKKTAKRLKKLEKRFEKFERRVDARFEQVDARFELVDARFEQVDARFDKVETVLYAIAAHLDVPGVTAPAPADSPDGSQP